MKKGWKLSTQHAPGKAIWNEYVNEETGESTYQEITSKEIMSSQGCDHTFERIDKLGNVVCRSCGLGKRIINGLHRLQDGKIEVIK